MAEKEYIERGTLMEEINRIGGHNLCEWETIGVKALVERQPAADVVEVRHGEWTRIEINGKHYGQIYYQHKECSVNETQLFPSPYDYCPHCGAKMDGGK